MDPSDNHTCPVIGFPIALIFAWAFEITPDGLKKTKEVDVVESISKSTGRRLNNWIITVLSVAIIALLIDSIVLRNGIRPPIFRVDNTAKVVFAVLPFDVRGSEDINYLREGMVDLVSTKLDKSGAMQSLDPNIVLSTDETLDWIVDLLAKFALHTHQAYDAYLDGNSAQALSHLQIARRQYFPLEQSVDVTTRFMPQSELEAQIYFEKGEYVKALQVYDRFRNIKCPLSLFFHMPYVIYSQSCLPRPVGPI